MRKKIAIIGAGISGLTLAQQLKDHADVVVLEKARGVGGRMSTRRVEPYSFDHGTQCFTARTKAFQDFLAPYQANGIIAEWSGKVINLEIGKKITKRMWFEPHLVAAPHMNSLCKIMAEGLDVRLSIEVAPLTHKAGDKWELADVTGQKLGDFDWIVSTAPPVQTQTLMMVALPENTALQEASMQGCYALMIGFDKAWDKQWIAAKVRDNPLKWITVNSTKPARDKNVTCFVAHSRNDWADKHIDDDLEQTQDFLITQFEKVTGISCAQAGFISLHRWKYAIVKETQQAGFYVDAAHKIAATSDWASTSRIEEVWQNASSLAQAITKL